MKEIIRNLKALVLAVAVLFAFNFLYAAWTDPAADPTGSNAPAPINVSSASQTKAGPLWANGGFFTTSGGYFAGNVGIGVVSPTQKLDVNGYVKGNDGLCIGSDCRSSWPSGGASVPSSCAEGQTIKYSAGSWQCTNILVDGYDSGWVAVGNDQDLTLTHNLGTTAVIGSVWFSETSNGSGRVYGPAVFSWREHNPEFVAGVSIWKLTNSQVFVRTGHDFRIPRTSPGTDAYDIYYSGYVRVVLLGVN